MFPCSSIVTAAFSLDDVTLVNFLSRFAFFWSSNTALFFKTKSSILLSEYLILLYSFVLSVAPNNSITELSKVTLFALWIDTLTLGFALVPRFFIYIVEVPAELDALPEPNILPFKAKLLYPVPSIFISIPFVTEINEKS